MIFVLVFSGSDCRYAVAWQVDPSNSNNLLFELVVETDEEYAAIGFSTNDDMVCTHARRSQNLGSFCSFLRFWYSSDTRMSARPPGCQQLPGWFQDETDTMHCIATTDSSPLFNIQHGYNGKVAGEDFNERRRIVSPVERNLSALMTPKDNLATGQNCNLVFQAMVPYFQSLPIFFLAVPSSGSQLWRFLGI